MVRSRSPRRHRGCSAAELEAFDVREHHRRWAFPALVVPGTGSVRPMARKPDPKSKAGFVRSFPASTPAADIVTKGKAKGIKLDVRYVYSVRTAVRAKRKKTRTAPSAPVAKRGPGRPPNRRR